MKKQTRHLLRKIIIGSLALVLFVVVVLSSLHLAFPNEIKWWVILITIFGSVLVFVITILLIEYYARRGKQC
ncbi:MAG: hypothetical protein PHT30_04885 [Bacilli bacterium]|nr:hypothetical protein [Bacilli bacterium]